LLYLFIAFVHKNFAYCNFNCQQTRVMALSEKSEFILCEIKSALFHDSSHRNGYIAAFRFICDAYNLFGIKVEVTLMSVRLKGVKTLRTQDTSDTRHFGTIRLVPKCPDSSALVPKCLTDTSALVPNCLDLKHTYLVYL